MAQLPAAGQHKPSWRLASLALLLGLATTGLQAQTPAMQDGGMCRQLCQGDKTRCIQNKRVLGAEEIAALVGLWGAAAIQPKAFEGTSAIDAKRDMRDVLSDKQRAATDSQSAAREWDSKCNQSFAQCLVNCSLAPAATPGSGPQD